MIKLLCCLLFATVLSALPHDTWLLFLADGRSASLSLRTGMDFPQSLNPVVPENIRAQLRDPAGAVSDVGGWRADEATQSSMAVLGELKPGLHVAWADTQPKLITLEARKFNDYLLHDGMPHVLAARMDAAEEGKDAVEQYRKCAKVMFQIGSSLEGPFDRPTGQRLEIVPLEHPLKVRPRQTLAVRVLWQGKPLARANLCWDHAGNGEDFTGCTWTDASGEAIVPIARVGAMTLRLVHMERPKAADHEWASCWASLTFTVPG